MSRPLEFSWFNWASDNKPQKCYVPDWKYLTNMLHELSKADGYKPTKDEYWLKQPLISTAIYQNDGDTRANKNVVGWDILMLDIDNVDEPLDHYLEMFAPFNFVVSSSANCTNDKLKIRAIFPFAERVPSDKIPEVWFAAQAWLGIADEQTKDKSRMMYIPAQYSNQGEKYRHIFVENDGLDLNWEGMIEKYPMPPPIEKFKVHNPLRNLKKKIFVANNPTPSMDIQDPNCPFCDQNMINDYILTPAGGHHRAIYLFMVKAAYRADKLGYPISVEELADLGKQVDEMDGSWYNDDRYLLNARCALEYIG